MAFVDWLGWPWAPAWLSNVNAAAPTFSVNVALDAGGESVGWIFEAPRTGTLKAFGFGVQTVTNDPDNGLRVSWFSIASGLPNAETHFDIIDPSPLTTGFKTTGIISDDGSDTGAKKAVTQGERVCAVVTIENFQAGDSVGIRAHTNGIWQGPGFSRGFPYYVTDVGGAGWAKGGAGGEGNFNFAVQYDDDIWYPIVGAAPISSITTRVLNSGSNPDEEALRFSVPVPLRLKGVQFMATFAGTTSTAVARLYADDDTILATATTVGGSSDVGGGTGSGQIVNLIFSTSVELDANTTYRLAVHATGAGNVSMYFVSALDGNLINAFPLGANFTHSERNNPGVWGNSSLSVPLITPLFDAIDPVKGGVAAHMGALVGRLIQRYRRRRQEF